MGRQGAARLAPPARPRHYGAMADEALDPVQVAEYVRALFAPEDDLLRELRVEAEQRGLPQIQISPEEGRLLQVLLTAARAGRVLEIGTLAGYSAIWMARALPQGGRLVTIEIEPAHAELAREFVTRAGLADVVDVRTGDARVLLEELDDKEPFDACFIDADKSGYPVYLQHALRLVRSGGLILGDNALWSGRVLREPESDETRAMQAFNQRLAQPDLLGTIVPVRDGLAVAVVRDGAGAGARPTGELLSLPPLDIVAP